ncbi:MAG: hypothetical protein V3W04_07685 [Gammaproteobacteria bacterium]
MKIKPIALSAIIATILLLLIHGLVRFTDERYSSAVSRMFVPAIIAEMELSGNNIDGFGGNASLIVINAMTWVLLWFLTLFELKLFSIIAKTSSSKPK